ncbi:MAG: DUF4258 domain-containing protein [Cyanobacteria bacterium P01_D01_bin.156]
MNQGQEDILFEVETPLGFTVRTTVEYWDYISTIKHPIMRGREADVRETLANPNEVHVSKNDPHVYLFYRNDGEKRWICGVTKKMNGDGFLITAY